MIACSAVHLLGQRIAPATATGSRKITIRCGLRNRAFVVLEELVQVGHLEAPHRRLGVLSCDQRVETSEIAGAQHLSDLGILVDRLVDMVAAPDAGGLQHGGEHAGAGSCETSDQHVCSAPRAIA